MGKTLDMMSRGASLREYPMRRMSKLGMVLLSLTLAGCSSTDQIFVGDSRPSIYPEPVSAQEEKRDSRFFLALPHDDVGPAVDMLPREAK